MPIEYLMYKPQRDYTSYTKVHNSIGIPILSMNLIFKAKYL